MGQEIRTQKEATNERQVKNNAVQVKPAQTKEDLRDKKRRNSSIQKTSRSSKPNRKFLYASIAKETNEIVIVRKNGDHISFVEWEKLIQILGTDYVSRV
ncbi:Uncharacterized protein FKW44_024098 [Caligus rogercresseyi]|uniref:Uncharacterized protein n=1 Tax=Caligus rogercresseyi TaxID=217165 RepID=A0A7T8GMB8_CALRO|nr:Uncharacterized protein FKW44_024098 [Caligus rogercresseyi]